MTYHDDRPSLHELLERETRPTSKLPPPSREHLSSTRIRLFKEARRDSDRAMETANRILAELRAMGVEVET